METARSVSTLLFRFFYYIANLLEGIVVYLATTYWPLREEWAVSYTNQYRNYGIRTTSRSESAHAELRNVLVNPMTSLLGVFEAIQLLVRRKEEVYEAKVAREATSCRDVFRRNALLTPIAEKVSWKGLQLIHSQSLWARRHMLDGNDPSFCYLRYNDQFGLPCVHQLIRRMRLQEDERGNKVVEVIKPLSLDEIDGQWVLKKDLVSCNISTGNTTL